MSERAQKMWEAFCSELAQPPTDDMKGALSTSLRTFADNMNGYPSILYKIADELGKMHIKPKTAYIEFDCPIEDFFEEWEDGNDAEPTQEDYDNWAFGTAMGCFERYRYELDNHLKLK